MAMRGLRARIAVNASRICTRAATSIALIASSASSTLGPVTIARAIVTGPSVLLADEAMSAIDVAARVQILDAFTAIRARNPRMAMLFVSHDLGVVQHIADRVLVLHEGRVVERGTVRQILETPQEDYTKALIEAATL